MTKPELQRELNHAYELLAKLKDRKARGEKVQTSIAAVQTCIRYLKARLGEE